MIDHKTDPAWNLDLARKNATRAIGYLERCAKGDEIQGVIREACALEQRIMELIDGLGDIDSNPIRDSGDTASRGE